MLIDKKAEYRAKLFKAIKDYHEGRKTAPRPSQRSNVQDTLFDIDEDENTHTPEHSRQER